MYFTKVNQCINNSQYVEQGRRMEDQGIEGREDVRKDREGKRQRQSERKREFFISRGKPNTYGDVSWN